MISFILGKPGGGKTLYGCRQILDELCRKVSRPVVTNLVLRRHKVADYIASRTGCSQEEAIAKVEDLLWSLSDDDMKAFYRIRGRGLFLNPKDDREIAGRTDKVVDYRPVESGCLYVLDEIQNVFNARGWKDSGSGAIYYLSQHRKLDDDVILISQHPELVDKQFRMLVHEWHTIRNRHQDKLGPFKLGSHFLRRSYYVLPVANVRPFEEEKFAFSGAVADCYDTMAGVGIRGRGDPSLKAANGVPLWTLYAAGAAVVVVGVSVVYFTPGLLRRMYKPGPVATEGVSTFMHAVTPVASAAPPSSAVSSPRAVTAPSLSSPVDAPVSPLYVDYPHSLVMMDDGHFYPLSSFSSVVGVRSSIIEGWRVPVHGHPDAILISAARLSSLSDSHAP